MVAALLALPGALSGTVRAFLWRISPALAVAAIALLQPWVVDIRLGEGAVMPFQVALVVLVGLMLLLRRDAARFAALAAVGFIVTAAWQPGMNVIETTRSFFGVHRVVETPNGTHRVLYHGTTIHGAERVREADGTPVTGRPEPLTYYYHGRADLGRPSPQRAARKALCATSRWSVSGPGASRATATTARAGRFFEIDPEVVRLARDPNRFRFLVELRPAGARSCSATRA